MSFEADSGVFVVTLAPGSSLSQAQLLKEVRRLGSERGHDYVVRWRAEPGAGAVVASVGVPFSLPALDGDYAFGDVLGRSPAVVVFWASWCAPCIEEAPHLAKLYREYHERGLEMVSVSIDDAADLPKLRALVSSLDLPYPVALDPEGVVLAQYAKGGTIPSTFVLNKSGEVAYFHGNFEEGDERALEAAVRAVLEGTDSEGKR